MPGVIAMRMRIWEKEEDLGSRRATIFKMEVQGRKVTFWSRSDISACSCSGKAYRHVHCPCSDCNGQATDRSTELRHLYMYNYGTISQALVKYPMIFQISVTSCSLIFPGISHFCEFTSLMALQQFPKKREKTLTISHVRFPGISLEWGWKNPSHFPNLGNNYSVISIPQ